MVANRELHAGEEIITEMPFVIGPKACTYPLCLSCFTPWPPKPNDKPLCSKCGWPVCGQECENASQHKDYECQVNKILIEELFSKFSQILRKIVIVNLFNK